MQNVPISNGLARLLFLLFVIAAPVLGGPPEGYGTYLDMKDQFVLALPEGWSVFDQGLAMTGKRAKTGPPIIFCSEVIDPEAASSGDGEAMSKLIEQLVGVELGDVPGFMLDRGAAKKGMSCAGFGSKAEKKLLKLVGSDPMFGYERTTREEPHAEPVTVGGCQGLRVKGKGTTRDGEGKNLDVFAVSDGDVLFLFKLLNLDEYYSNNVEMFEKVLSTLEMAIVAKGQN